MAASGKICCLTVVLVLPAVFNGAMGQTVVSLIGGTATFRDVTIPGTGETTVVTGQGAEMLVLDIFGSRVSPGFQNRVTVTSFNNGFSGGRASFVIRSVQKRDGGAFKCRSQFEGEQLCGNAILIVADTPTKPILTLLTDTVVVGSDVVVECESTSTSSPANNGVLRLVYNLKENGRLALPQPTPVSRFKISSVSKAKAGNRYSCVAYEENTQNNQLTGLTSPDSEPYIMDPLYPPEGPILTPPNASYVVSSGDEVPDVTCSSDCNPACSIDWYKDQQIFQSGNRLVLGTVDKTDAGNYFCRARNTLDTKDGPLIITVQDKVSEPELIPPRTQYTVTEGTAIGDIQCRAQCTPACRYSWVKDGQRESDTGVLTLGSATLSTAGTYTCRASNGEDSSEASLVVDVQYPPRKPAGREILSPSSRSYVVEEGALVLPDIVCQADCNPPCNVQWTGEGGQTISSGATLSLGTASRDDTGLYTCTTANALGQLNDSVSVNIEFQPEQVSFTPPDTQYSVVEGADVFPDIRCTAVCNPECQYAWYKDQDVTQRIETGLLSLDLADRFYTGTFTCIAFNDLGDATKTLTVDVKYGPDRASLDPPRDSYTLPSGSVLSPVTCSADCNPTCTFRWVKDDSPDPVTTSKTLTLGRVDPATAGIYKCVATNDYGSANVKFDVSVQFGPNRTLDLQPPQTGHDLSEGDNLTVTCSASCDPVCSFRWEDNSGSTVAGDGTLRLRDVTRDNAGQYTCVADNGLGTPARRAITVNVQVGPRGKITITPPLPVIPVKQGNSLVLTCSAECSPICVLTWRKGSQDLTSSNGLLTLNDVRKEQGGAYVCEASNSVATDRKTVELEVQYGPGNSITFNPDKATFDTEETSDLSITCSADCNPDCSFVWEQGSSQVSRSPVLFLENVQRSQAGSYSCTADNIANQPMTKQVTVDVLYGPSEIRLFPDERQLYPIQGSSVSLKCWAECNPPCSYLWYKGSLLLPEAVNGELDLRNVTTASSGNYVCVATNDKHDPATRSVDINVRAGPGTTIRFNPPDDAAVVTEGRQFQVDCIAECSPPCSYKWRKGAVLITDQSTLAFAVTDRQKAGSYICFASNDANNQASKPLSLEVQYGPGDSISLFPPWKNQSYMEGAPFNIKCSAECQPPCTYTWFLGPNQLQYQDGVLSSDSASQDQAGTYTCQASNGIGSTSTASVVVDIQTGPGSTVTFIPPGNRPVVKEGEDLLVKCTADCVPACTYKWIFDTQELNTADGLLELRSVDRTQKGTYSCVADNGFGNQGTKPLNVDVQYGPEGAIEVFPNVSSHVLNEGGSLSLKCSADCNPDCRYTWYQGNEVVRSAQGVLSLVAVGPENAGTYRCSAENSIGLASSGDVAVVVKTGPGNTVRIEPEGDVYNVTEGRQLQLKCSAVCSPACTYTWYYGFERVKRDDGVLVIDDVMRNASGPFVCSAANDVGLKGSKMIKVNVLYGPTDGIALDPSTNVTVVVLDQPFTLRCSANCHPPCTYSWFLGPLPKDSEGGKLTVGRASVADGGSFKCRAVNDVGSLMSEPVTVDVHYGPRDTIGLAPEGLYVVKEGEDVEVTCSADCKPDCDYSWFAGAESVASKDGKLIIPQYTRSMPRFFSCFADNGLGARAMAALQIQVQYGPGDEVLLFPSTSPITTTLGGAVSVQCTADCSPECTYTWTKDGQEIFTRLPGVLELLGVRPEQAGTYVCSAQNEVVDAPATASVGVEVLSGQGATIRFVPPGLTAEVEEGSTLRVQCTANCVPRCKFSWTKDAQVTSSSSLLLLISTTREEAGAYQCHALNDLGVNVTQQLAVSVHYGPAGTTKLFPPDTTRSLNRGDTLTVQCSALCYPPCAYSWRKGAQPLPTKEGVLLVPNVTPADSGRYTCSASSHTGASESVSLAVNVNFGPEDTITFEPPGNSQSVLEGDTFQVRCTADCLPACTYTWYLASRRLDTTDGLLFISDVNRDDAGTYTCHADNGVGRRMTEELLLDVLFPPNTPTLEPPTTTYTVREKIDSVADIRCFSACNPRCQIQWLKDGTELDTVGNVLSLNTPDRSADGVYSCVASNDHGGRQKDLTLRVNYAPTITVFAINDQRTMATVPEKYPVTLNCRVSSQPPSTIHLFNGSRLLQESKDKLQAKYQWKQAECLDAGQYACEADNGVGAKVSLSADLNVLCSPRLDPRVFKQPYVASRLGQTAVIRVHVLAQPTPSFLWYKLRDGASSAILAGSNGTQGQSDKFFTVDGTTSTLTIENVQLADFGDYVVRMVNTQGTANYTLSLVPQSAPYPARDLTARPISAKSVELTWSPGFNGGARQQFLLEYRKPGTNGWLILELDAGIEDVAPSVSQNVTDLTPSTAYVFRLRSRNLHGYSNYSDPVRVVTKDSKEPEPSRGDVNPTPVLMGVGLALGFLVGAGITAIVVVSKCRPKPRKHGITAIVVVSKCRPKPRKNGDNTIDDFRSDTTYDTLYLRDALWAQRHIKMRQNGGGLDGYDYKQPEDTVRGYNDYTGALKPLSEMRTSL